jgi:hypothetical protein
MKLLSLEIASEIPDIAPYKLAKLVLPISSSKIRNRLFLRWSASSLRNSA